jgi:2-polyprenyl-3-methyl-5-hydroxy-6-metoxy-1,4-benzoquinol methylase
VTDGELTPGIDEQAGYYDELYARHRPANRLQLERAAAILAALHETGLEAPRICDLGCGSGWLTAILGCFGDSVGVELSPVASRAASERFRHVSFVAADALEWQHEGPPFDLVVSQEVIEHFADQAAYARKVASLLRSGGYFILTTPNAATFRAWPDADRIAWSNQPIENHLTAAELARLLAPDFDVQSIRSITLGPGHGFARRLAVSEKLRHALQATRLLRIWNAAALRAGLGMHLVAVARRR